MKKDDEKKSWVLTLSCTVIKEVITNECTEAEAMADPYGNLSSERELSQPDWEVKAIEPNE